MKKLGKLKLNQLMQSDLEKKEMSSIIGGANCCICGCQYANSGGSSSGGNGGANNSGGYSSSSGGWGSGSFG
jgi:natural product precursor